MSQLRNIGGISFHCSSRRFRLSGRQDLTIPNLFCFMASLTFQPGCMADQTYLLVWQPHRNKADDIPPTRAKKTIGCHFP